MKYGLYGLAFGFCALSFSMTAPAIAKEPSESFCSIIRETEDGKFTYEVKTGWSLYRAQKEAGLIQYDQGVSGVSCLRDPNLLTEEDMETLNQGLSISLADPKKGLGSIVTYKMKDGVISWESSNEVSKKMRKKIEKSISRLQGGE